jgi:hypothetical protein
MCWDVAVTYALVESSQADKSESGTCVHAQHELVAYMTKSPYSPFGQPDVCQFLLLLLVLHFTAPADGDCAEPGVC